MGANKADCSIKIEKKVIDKIIINRKGMIVYDDKTNLVILQSKV